MVATSCIFKNFKERKLFQQFLAIELQLHTAKVKLMDNIKYEGTTLTLLASKHVASQISYRYIAMMSNTVVITITILELTIAYQVARYFHTK